VRSVDRSGGDPGENRKLRLRKGLANVLENPRLERTAGSASTQDEGRGRVVRGWIQPLPNVLDGLPNHKNAVVMKR
jgi:hypothetical protein